MIPLLTFILIVSVSEVFSDGKVVVLAFDGFRPDLYNSLYTPEIYRIRNVSAGPSHMVSIFPTKTSVTLHSVSTGVYPDLHGVYNNEMFDDDGGVMKFSEKMFNGFNKKIIPIWIENQQKGGKSGVMMWPGGEFKYTDLEANYHVPFEATTTWETRANTIVNWIKNENCNLVMAYFEDKPCYDIRKDLDHKIQHAADIDNIIVYIRQRIPSEFDMVIISDHGVSTVESKCVLMIEDYITDINIPKIVSGPLVFLKVPDPTERSKLVESLNSKITKFKAFTKENLSDSYIKQLNTLNEVIILQASTKFTFMERTKFENLKSDQGVSEQNFMTLENGYDKDVADMNGFFLGIGSSFIGYEFPKNVIQLIDVYPLLKVLLLLKGNASDVQNMTKLSDEVKKFLKPTVVKNYENAEKQKEF